MDRRDSVRERRHALHGVRPTALGASARHRGQDRSRRARRRAKRDATMGGTRRHGPSRRQEERRLDIAPIEASGPLAWSAVGTVLVVVQALLIVVLVSYRVVRRARRGT